MDVGMRCAVMFVYDENEIWNGIYGDNGARENGLIDWCERQMYL